MDLFGLIGKPGFDIFTAYADFDFANFVFNLVFCATAATIVSGAMAERTKFLSYCIYSGVISALIYPIEAHWIWGGGWLSQIGFHDFAGSCAIHMVGGISALIGAKILGPRIGKFQKDAGGRVTKVNAFPGHSIAFGALGVFILWLGWYGFNGAAAKSVNQLGSIFLTTTMAPAVATVVCMIFTWLKYGKPDVSMCLNASLAGLVAVTAGCDVTDALGSSIIGAVAGLLVVFGVWFLDHMLPEYVEEGTVAPVLVDGVVPVAEAVPVKKVPTFDETTPKFTKIDIICKESRFEFLKSAMMDIGITGMTVSHVLGCGIQKGKPEYYRGVEVEATLLPKIQVEIVVSKVPVRSVIETAKKVLYTGHIGDGKIFVYDVENVVKVRTGEEGYDALQDVE